MTAFSASFSVSRREERAATVSLSHSFLPVSWSMPACTLTRAEPLGSQLIEPRWRPRTGLGVATRRKLPRSEATKEATTRDRLQ